jgi:sortase (surface protein transpeptidase)
MTGAVAPAHGVATVDARAGANNFYLLGHNPGVFAPLLGVGPGGWVRYWDGQGTPHDFQVQARYQVSRTDVSPLVASYGSPTLTLQTCLTGTTGTVWVWRAAAR